MPETEPKRQNGTGVRRGRHMRSESDGEVSAEGENHNGGGDKDSARWHNAGKRSFSIL